MNLASRIFLFAYTAAMVSVATGFYAQHKSEGLWPVTLSSWARALWAPKELCISLFASNALGYRDARRDNARTTVVNIKKQCRSIRKRFLAPLTTQTTKAEKILICNSHLLQT